MRPVSRLDYDGGSSPLRAANDALEEPSPAPSTTPRCHTTGVQSPCGEEQARGRNVTIQIVQEGARLCVYSRPVPFLDRSEA
ncbi:MAG: hypothetical protein JRN23_05615 [Nitrososphaerota archaeon]|nr:hypothetical protein [Nitrososphaerota archaeon]MDG7021387.1 hypothetical protein [Nitrososphaerota archaeon]MDG7022522.1 hypothetical protein [Nitrososphaerota archaeon]